MRRELGIISFAAMLLGMPAPAFAESYGDALRKVQEQVKLFEEVFKSEYVGFAPTGGDLAAQLRALKEYATKVKANPDNYTRASPDSNQSVAAARQAEADRQAEEAEAARRRAAEAEAARAREPAAAPPAGTTTQEAANPPVSGEAGSPAPAAGAQEPAAAGGANHTNAQCRDLVPRIQGQLNPYIGAVDAIHLACYNIASRYPGELGDIGMWSSSNQSRTAVSSSNPPPSIFTNAMLLGAGAQMGIPRRTLVQDVLIWTDEGECGGDTCGEACVKAIGEMTEAIAYNERLIGALTTGKDAILTYMGCTEAVREEAKQRNAQRSQEARAARQQLLASTLAAGCTSRFKLVTGQSTVTAEEGNDCKASENRWLLQGNTIVHNGDNTDCTRCMRGSCTYTETPELEALAIQCATQLLQPTAAQPAAQPAPSAASTFTEQSAIAAFMAVSTEERQ